MEASNTRSRCEGTTSSSTLRRCHGLQYVFIFPTAQVTDLIFSPKWDSLEANTAAPYILSLKSNGCIIFVAALSPTQLIVTSKHSMGAVDPSVQSQSMSHAQAGESWLRKYLAKIGKEEKDMAKELWEKNWTAIAEVWSLFLFLSVSYILYFSLPSSAMTISKNTSSVTRPKRPACIYTD